MTARAACLLGLSLVLAALVHGGFYAAGHDFVVNRFTGRFQFVPAVGEDEANTPVRSVRALTSRRPEARLGRSARGAAWRAIPVRRGSHGRWPSLHDPRPCAARGCAPH